MNGAGRIDAGTVRRKRVRLGAASARASSRLTTKRGPAPDEAAADDAAAGADGTGVCPWGGPTSTPSGADVVLALASPAVTALA